MPVPSQMSLRKIPAPLHLRVRRAYAAAWRALICTHTTEAIQFVGEFAPRLPVLKALDLYFEVAAVPESMQESVWARAITALDLSALPPPVEFPRIEGWQRLRLDLVLESMRDRQRYEARTLHLARIVGARIAEAVLTTHVRNVLSLAAQLDGVLPVDQVTQLYLTEFTLPHATAMMVSQRVQAEVAEEQLRAAQEEPVPVLQQAEDTEEEQAWSGVLPEPAHDGFP